MLAQSMMIRNCSHLLPLWQASHLGLVRTLKISGRDTNCDIQLIRVFCEDQLGWGVNVSAFYFGAFFTPQHIFDRVRSLVCGVDLWREQTGKTQVFEGGSPVTGTSQVFMGGAPPPKTNSQVQTQQHPTSHTFELGGHFSKHSFALQCLKTVRKHCSASEICVKPIF